MNRSWN